MAGAGVGIGIIFGNYLSGAMRNPSAAQKQFPNLLLGFALAEATGLFGISSCVNHSICILNLMIKKIYFQSIFLSFLFSLEAFAAESGGMPQLNPEFWISQIFWLTLTFGILYIILSKLILPKISDNLESRKSQILENIEAAEKQRENSEEKLKEYEEIVSKSKTEAKSIFSQAREKALKDINAKKEVLDKQIDNEISKAEQEIKELRSGGS